MQNSHVSHTKCQCSVCMRFCWCFSDNTQHSVREPMRNLRFCLIFVFVVLLSTLTFAQVQNGQFAGTVTDPSGAAVANAKVTITNKATNLSVTVMTNSTGAYTAN